MIPDCIKTTLKIQPAVIFFSIVSALSKYASRMLPENQGSIQETMMAVANNWKLLAVIATMFISLFAYAIIWQMIIKDAQIAVIYANKSSEILWAQAAAVIFFQEHLGWCNIVGILVIFCGIMLTNLGTVKHA